METSEIPIRANIVFPYPYSEMDVRMNRGIDSKRKATV
jgi:hypothetical protein